jgi:hypothetical protein
MRRGLYPHLQKPRRQFTVSVSTTLRLIEPLVAVTVSVFVPAGVPGSTIGGVLGPPQPAITKIIVNAVTHAIAVVRFRTRLARRAIAIIAASSTISQIICRSTGPNLCVTSGFSRCGDDRAVVVTLIGTATVVPERFTLAGTPQLASAGAPVQLNAKFPLNPFTGVSASEYVAVCPGLTLAVVSPFADTKITFGPLPLDAANRCANFSASTEPNPLAAS